MPASSDAEFYIRDGESADLAPITDIERESPGSACWNPDAYLAHDLRVAVWKNRVAGFVITRRVAADETELLNIAVAPVFRRRGVGTALIRDVLRRFPGPIFLEVRDSNLGARKFYEVLGFQPVGIRPEYYRNPSEAAVVMKIHSC